MVLTSLQLDPKEFERRTGWILKAEGACKGDTCVPLPDDTGSAALDARMISHRLGMPLVHDPDTDVWCLGPEALGRALTTAQAPDLILPDYQGHQFALSSLRGQKVVLVAWASW